jgi:hypothetical protein
MEIGSWTNRAVSIPVIFVGNAPVMLALPGSRCNPSDERAPGGVEDPTRHLRRRLPNYAKLTRDRAYRSGNERPNLLVRQKNLWEMSGSGNLPSA